MAQIHLMRIGVVEPELLDAVGRGINEMLGCPVEPYPDPLNPAFALDPSRGQYNSTQILKRLETLALAPSDRILGITEVDLFIPILTFVFGEALLNRPPAIISLYRLRPQFYGLPPDPDRLLRRAITEAVHELGHTFNLIHCPDYACVMHASGVADEIDLKHSAFCADCATTLTTGNLSLRRYQ